MIWLLNLRFLRASIMRLSLVGWNRLRLNWQLLHALVNAKVVCAAVVVVAVVVLLVLLGGMTNMESMIVSPAAVHYGQLFGNLTAAGHEPNMARCACVSCNSCTCACSCRGGEQQDWEWPECWVGNKDSFSKNLWVYISTYLAWLRRSVGCWGLLWEAWLVWTDIGPFFDNYSVCSESF